MEFKLSAGIGISVGTGATIDIESQVVMSVGIFEGGKVTGEVGVLGSWTGVGGRSDHRGTVKVGIGSGVFSIGRIGIVREYMKDMEEVQTGSRLYASSGSFLQVGTVAFCCVGVDTCWLFKSTMQTSRISCITGACVSLGW